MDGELDERVKETKIRIDAGAGPRGRFHSLFRPGLRCQNAEFATSQRRHSTQSNPNSDSRAAGNSVRQPAGYISGDADADPNAPTSTQPNRRANSD